MGALMNDALGIGLAATQVGVLHRVLVYRVEHDSPVNALVNPVLEWSGGDKETMEGLITASGLDWTIALDPALSRDPARER